MPEIKRRGLPLNQAKKALILIHGRGATAESILSLSSYLNIADYAILAPQANSNAWYPYGFMQSDKGNFQALESSLKQLEVLVEEVLEFGINSKNIYFLGFSQGACLGLEFAARQATRYGGVVAFTGGLVGEVLDSGKYSGDFGSTPIYIGGSKLDFHVPAKRMKDSAELLKKMGAEVTLRFFDDPEHTIRREELEWVNQHIFL
jgi:phospholipase/carboxylesterase